MPALNVMTTCDTLASSASRMVCIRSCESGRTELFPMSAPWMDSATSASTKTGIALLRTLSSTTGPAWESRTSIFWTRMSDELLAVSSAPADKVANKNAHPTRNPPSLPMEPPENVCSKNVYSNMGASALEEKLKILRSAICVALGVSLALRALAQSAPTPAQQQLHEIYKELVEINTTDSAGSCTVAAEAMAARLKAGRLPARDVQIIVPPGGPKKGNLVARYRGTGAKRPIMLLGHLDVVEAKREDWQRDPFKLVEENGYFYARGAADDKLVPTLLAGATDGRFTINAGIPT